ncbi:hypothetical protein [Microbacterium sp. SSM24]|uniref:hypothetical protein n=1 Tax=Microbacterium sp. SSM24 TaxID=2991714 RepID=UPI002226B423|nr:hypothetical protein [Microbacterium sp. SSM24]MCW3493881.1 hypothetical protein [Microbacterium sp. SSM24]
MRKQTLIASVSTVALAGALVVGLFAGAVSIVGFPARAVVGALGIGLGVVGSFFLWKVDQQRWSSKRVCF